MPGRRSKSKGARGEREWRDFLRSHGISAIRGRQNRGGPGSPDVISDLEDIHFEVKRTESFRLYPALAQACQDCNVDQLPVVAHRSNHNDWVIVLRAEDFMKLIGVRNDKSNP